MISVTPGLLNVCHDFNVEACLSGYVSLSFILLMLGMMPLTCDACHIRYVLTDGLKALPQTNTLSVLTS